jgi:hypothetical protein
VTETPTQPPDVEFTEEEIRTVRRIAHNCYVDGWPDDKATLEHIAHKMTERHAPVLSAEDREALEYALAFLKECGDDDGAPHEARIRALLSKEGT